MEERKDNNKNIKILRTTLKEKGVETLIENVKEIQAKANAITRKLNEKEALLKKAKAEKVSVTENVEIKDVQPEKVEDKKPLKEEKEVVQAKKQEVKTEKAEKVEKVEIPEKPAKKEEIKVSKPSKVEEKPVNKEEKKSEPVKEEVKQDKKVETSNKAESSKKSEVKTEKKAENAEKPVAPVKEVKVEEKKEPAKKSILSFIVKKADPKAEEKQRRENAERRAQRNEREHGERFERGERPDRNGQRSQHGQGERNFSDRPFTPRNNNNGNGSSFTPRPQANRRPQEIAFVPPKDNKPTKKRTEKNYEEKHSVSKRSLIKEVTIADFDENKTGYRKVRKPKHKKEEQVNTIKIENAVITKEITPIKELSEKFGISAVEITKRLFKEGIVKTINDSIDFDTAAFIAADLGIEVELKLEKTAEELMHEGFMDEDDSSKLVKRPPVVTVMGHVDHGKTSLLDRIRSASVASGEAGGITQHIGAYSVDVHGNKITFIDTPGHAAFTAMRARGAQVTDIAIIVIAADDGIMPQTIEAINHAKAAGVSIIIAANKVDKPHVDLDKLRQQLSEQELLVEEWGGETIMVPVSAKTGIGMDKLMESIILVSEMLELKANPDRKARGTVIEAKLDKGKGPMASVLVQNGTLRTGDNIVAGTVVGHVRAMINDKGVMVKEAGPSMAVSVLGLADVPNAGDSIFAVDEEKLSKLVAEERRNKEREDMIRLQQKVTLDDLFSKISEGELKNLNLIVKADVQGSAEAVKQSLAELSTDEVKVSIIHAGVGAINETDVTLAESSNAIIIGFNVRPDAMAKNAAERSKVDIKLYRVIYDAIEDIKKAMKGMLEPKFNDVYTGKAEVRETFKISGVGTVAGCHVTDGKVVRQAKLRIYRNDVMICEGNVKQLKRFKDEVKEVNQGYECGISIEGFNDIKVGDFIESYIVEESK